MVEYRIDQEVLESVLPILMQSFRTIDELEMVNSFAGTLRDLAIFTRELNKNQQLELAQFYQLETFEDKMLVFRKGDPSFCIYVVLKGCIEIINLKDDSIEHVTYVGPGKMVGERGLARNLPRSLSAITRCKTILMTLEKDKFKRYMLDQIHASLEEKVAFIQKYIPGMNSFTKNHKERMAYSLNTLWFHRGESVVEQGGMVDQLYFLADGECILSKGTSFHKIVISKLGVGSVIGDESIFYMHPATYSIIVHSEMLKMYRLSRHDLYMHIPENTIEILKHNCRIKFQGRHLLHQRLSPVISPRAPELIQSEKFTKAAPGARKRLLRVEERMNQHNTKVSNDCTSSSNHLLYKQMLEDLRLNTRSRLKKSNDAKSTHPYKRRANTYLTPHPSKIFLRKSSLPSIL